MNGACTEKVADTLLHNREGDALFVLAADPVTFILLFDDGTICFCGLILSINMIAVCYQPSPSLVLYLFGC